LWQYKALWVFGLILALTSASYSSQSSYRFNNRDFQGEGYTYQLEPGENFREQMNQAFQDARAEMQRLFDEGIPAKDRQLVINSIIAFVSVIVVLAIVGTFFRYVSETALIKMVDEHEETGEKRSVREGFRLGWSREAWRLFLIDLVIALPLILIGAAFFFVAFIPLVTGMSQGEVPGMLGVITTIGLSFLGVFLAIVVGVVISMVKAFFYRTAVLEGAGVFEAIRQGFSIVRHNFKDVGLMWLIMLGISIGWPLVLIPFLLVFGALTLLVGGGAVMALGGLTGAFAGQVGGIIATVIVGLVLAFLLLALPLAAVSGLKVTYQSSAWTLTYREIKALGSLEAEEPPALDEAAAA
jgi:hypothetical protein